MLHDLLGKTHRPHGSGARFGCWKARRIARLCRRGFCALGIVRDGIETFIDVSLALIEIRNRRLYRLAGFERFGDFCQAEFHLSRSYAYQLMDAAASVECQSTIPDVPPPTKAEQVRPL